MGDGSKIEWTEATWNPVTGCTKVSQGCKHCYAERGWPRLAAPRVNPNIYTGRAFTDVHCHPEKLDIPLRWKKPRRIFVNSMSDLFHEDVPFEFICKVIATCIQAKQHTFQILTKRPERMLEWSLRHFRERTSWPAPNIWLGVSVEDQATADERIPLLLQTPAAVRWISAEPLLSGIGLRDIDLGDLYWLDALTGNVRIFHDGGMTRAANYNKLNWVVVGGESGPHARPMHPDWVRSLRDQCQVTGVPFFFKQWGEWAPDCLCHGKKPCNSVDRPAPGKIGTMFRCGKKAAGRLLDGRAWDEYP